MSPQSLSLQSLRVRWRHFLDRSRERRDERRAKRARRSRRRLPFISRSRRLLTDALVILLIGTLGYLLSLELNRKVVILEPFEVPAVLAQHGYTGRAVARKLADHLNAIAQVETGWSSSSASFAESPSFVTTFDQDAADIQVQGAGFSLRTLANYLSQAFGRIPIRISGELTLESVAAQSIVAERGTEETGGEMPKLRVSVRVSSYPAISHLRELDSTRVHCALDALLDHAAEDVLELTEPYILARYFLFKDPERCRRCISRCLRTAPEADNAPARVLQGLLHYHSGNYEVAEATFRRTAEQEPRLVSAHLNLARTLHRQGRHAEADKRFRLAAEMPRGQAAVHYLWGDLLLDMGRTDEALQRMESAVDLAPEDPVAWYFLARALKTSSPDDALQGLNRALELAPFYSPALIAKKRILTSLGQDALATEISELLIQRAEEKRDQGDDCG